jgi:hypothetical protein
LSDLVSSDIIHLIDLVIVQKDKEGKVTIHELQQAGESTIQIFNPLKVDVSGMIKKEDLDMVGNLLEPNSTAAAMLFENEWAVKFKQTIINANGRLVMQERLPSTVVEEAVKDLEKVA